MEPIAGTDAGKEGFSNGRGAARQRHHQPSCAVEPGIALHLWGRDLLQQKVAAFADDSTTIGAAWCAPAIRASRESW
jgi:hypothetical protein